MGLMVACAVLVVIGLFMIAWWGDHDVVEVADGDDDAGTVARRYARSVVIAVVSGAVAGMLVTGPGGRLAMRLLAATAGDPAQGRVTEADEIVGRITTGGTIGFIAFNGLFFGLPSGALFMIIRRWLPFGRLAGLALGGLLLVVLAPALDPLRRENPDFDIVGPGWLSVLVFGSLVVAHGMTVAAVAGRYSQRLPLLSADRSILRYLPLIILLPVVPALVLTALFGAVVVGLSRIPGLTSALQSRQAAIAGRMALAAAALIALPRFIGTVVDIAGRGPA